MHSLVSNIGQITAAVLDGEDLATEDTCSRMFQIISNLQQNYPADFEQVFSSLPLESQNGINTLFSS